MGLSDHQFGKYMLTRTTKQPGWGDPAETEYKLWRQPGENSWMGTEGPAEKVGTVGVLHHRDSGYNSYPGPRGYPTDQPADDSASQISRYDENWARSSTHPADNPGQLPGQIPLFLHQGERGHDELAVAMMTKDARHMAPMMLGVAARDSMNTRGRVPEASTDLSVHSQRMVDHFKGIGAVPQGHESQRNNYTWKSPIEASVSGGLEGLHEVLGTHYPDDNETPVHVNEVSAGKRLTRSVLAAGRKLRSQGTQGSMFDASHYDKPKET